ncbi:MAG: hypothetical protein F2840_18285 [Actinobacteria bacterium]|uniref:Unannotated protein n=1 Tax=freshwater metagenome TaxID=449393 RepID=A0A6J7ME34_9ZZZZ|nr:hypothetical protein [Actinomycetota bacterium]
MSRLSIRAFTAIGAGALTVALIVSGGVPAVAAPASGPITQARDVLGVWVGELTGYNEGQEVDWQYRLTVRKARGQAGVAWEEWRDCVDHEAACAAGKATGGGWSQPSRVLFAMGPDHVIHGVSEAGITEAAPDETGGVLNVTYVCKGDPVGMWSSVANSVAPRMIYGGAYAVSGSLVRQRS